MSKRTVSDTQYTKATFIKPIKVIYKLQQGTNSENLHSYLQTKYMIQNFFMSLDMRERERT